MENSRFKTFDWNGTTILVSPPTGGMVDVQSEKHSMLMDKHAFDQMVINKEIIEIADGTSRNQ